MPASINWPRPEMRKPGAMLSRVLAVPLGLVGVENAAPLRRRDADDEIELDASRASSVQSF